jgi:hypothetical protein
MKFKNNILNSLKQIFDNYTADVVIDGENHKIGLFDTAGKNNKSKLYNTKILNPGNLIIINFRRGRL